MNTHSINCDQCEMLSINGIPCHETGCRNQGARFDADTGEWIEQTECRICGYACDVGAECCTDESEPYKDAQMHLLFSDARGIYIPRDFARDMDRAALRNVTDEELAILDDPDHESYWDVWSEVLDRARIVDMSGKEWFLYQDGDCWLIEVGAEHRDSIDRNADLSNCDQEWVIAA